MSKVLITGGAGFTGVNVARHYLAQGADVVVFDNLSRIGAVENLRWLRSQAAGEMADGASERLEVIVGDVRLPTDGLRKAVESSDVLIHLAGQVAVTTSVERPVEDFDVNARGTLNMLELVRKSNGKKPVFLFASTNKVYGGMEDVETIEGEERYAYRDFPHGIPEDRPLDFHSPYGCSKGAADQYVRDYARIYDIDSVVFRQSCIYGYRQFGVEDQGWVAWFTIAAVLGRGITIFGDGKQVRDVLFIDDLVSAYDQARSRIEEASGRVYNIGGGPGNTISLLDLLGHLEDRLDDGIEVSFDDWRPGDQPVYVSDIRKAEDDFGWTPQVDWREGVDRLLRWVRSNRDLLERLL